MITMMSEKILPTLYYDGMIINTTDQRGICALVGPYLLQNRTEHLFSKIYDSQTFLLYTTKSWINQLP